MKKVYNCCACGKRNLEKDEIAVCKKMLGRKIEKFFCYDCLANYLDCSVQDILDKIEEFKAQGCKLF
ncbi:MAG: hypothetical protein IJS60_00980 [Abditibacteriota bacterium]|nr:hypothetical protein [Abditibacteriota bacterium]